MEHEPRLRRIGWWRLGDDTRRYTPGIYGELGRDDGPGLVPALGVGEDESGRMADRAGAGERQPR